jgi:Tfp pilus assembly protein PilX
VLDIRTAIAVQGKVFMRQISNQTGFALVAAILANLILLAVGIIGLNLATVDLRISMKSVGDKKALSAAESGIHVMLTNFNPENLASAVVSDVQTDAALDPDTRYTVGTPSPPTTGSAMIPMAGYSIGGGQVWGQTRYDVAVTGSNTAHQTSVTVNVGLGYGPIEMTTMSR